jgi:hypothetical protein
LRSNTNTSIESIVNGERCSARSREGSIDAARYQSYQKLQREVSYLDRKRDIRSAIVEKKRWKKLSRLASERAQMKRT